MRRIRLFGLFALAVLAHVESLTYWFVSTDTFALVSSSRVRSTADLVGTFTRPMMDGTGFTNIALFYRPLATLTYTVDNWLWGLDPAGYHATNLLLQGIVVVLAALLVAEVTRRPATGLVTGALFALHPLTAEVVPVVARRHDVVMLAFLLVSLTLFLRGRRTGSRTSQWGAVALYVLALGAKEPALLLPALAFVLVVLERDDPLTLATGLAAVRAIVPFAVATAGYLAVRVTVLGGLGGYLEREPLETATWPTLVAKYLLTMWYPAEAVAVGTADDAGAWLVVPVALAVVAATALLAVGRRLRAAPTSEASSRVDGVARRILQLGSFAVFVAAVAAVPALLTLDRATLRPVRALVGYGGTTGLPFPYPYSDPASPLVGLALVAAAVAGVAWTLAGADGVLDRTERRSLAFFAVWLALPVGLFVRSGDYAIRSGYLSLVPAMALLAVPLLAGARSALADVRRTTDADSTGGGSGRFVGGEVPAGAHAVLVAAVLLLVVPMVAASPAIHPYDGWGATGEINRLTLTGLDAELADAPADRPVHVEGVARGVHEQRRAFPRVRSLGFLGPKSIQGWFAFTGADESRRVTMSNAVTLDRPPADAGFETAVDDDRVTVRVSYEEMPPRNHSPRIGPIRPLASSTRPR